MIMLDKKLYRDVSDLLELNVSDDKIVRILMVRGYTTEKVKRAIKDIRVKSEVVKKLEKCSVPVEEVIEASPSRRFSFFGKLFGNRQSEQEVIQEEVARLAAEEERLMKEAACIHKEIEKDLIEASRNAGEHPVSEEVREVLRIIDGLLGKLSDREIKSFSKSSEFRKYERIFRKYVGSDPMAGK